MAISLGLWWHSGPSSSLSGDMVGGGYVCMVVTHGLDGLNPSVENSFFCSGCPELGLELPAGLVKRRVHVQKAFFPKD